MLGSLASLRSNLQKGRLRFVEDIALAEVVGSVIEQADHLLQSKYYVASAVLYRAVLEERLRRICLTHALVPDKDKPTIVDFTQQLYKAQIIDKVQLKVVETMATIGNKAAHDHESVNIQDVRHMRDSLVTFLARHPLTPDVS